MKRIIKAMEETYLLPSRELVPGGWRASPARSATAIMNA